jgi:dynein heavy chain
MVFVDPKNLGYKPYFAKWMTKWNEKKEKYEILIDTFKELFPKYVEPCINLIFDGINED